MGVCAFDVTAWPGGFWPISKKILDCQCKKRQASPFSESYVFYHTPQTERKWTGAKTHGELKENRSPSMAWSVWCLLAISVVRVRFSAIPLRGQRCRFLVLEIHSRRGSEVT